MSEPLAPRGQMPGSFFGSCVGGLVRLSKARMHGGPRREHGRDACQAPPSTRHSMKPGGWGRSLKIKDPGSLLCAKCLASFLRFVRLCSWLMTPDHGIWAGDQSAGGLLHRYQRIILHHHPCRTASMSKLPGLGRTNFPSVNGSSSQPSGRFDSRSLTMRTSA